MQQQQLDMEKSLRKSAEKKLEIAQLQSQRNLEEIQSLKSQTLQIKVAQINAQFGTDSYSAVTKRLTNLC